MQRQRQKQKLVSRRATFIPVFLQRRSSFSTLIYLECESSINYTPSSRCLHTVQSSLLGIDFKGRKAKALRVGLKEKIIGCRPIFAAPMLAHSKSIQRSWRGSGLETPRCSNTLGMVSWDVNYSDVCKTTIRIHLHLVDE